MLCFRKMPLYNTVINDNINNKNELNNINNDIAILKDHKVIDVYK